MNLVDRYLKQKHNFNRLDTSYFFAGSTPPPKPIEGTLWFDTTVNNVNCYHNNTWVQMSGGKV